MKSYKRLLGSVFAILFFFVSLEVAARCYHFIKYKDPSVFLYGRKFFSDLAESMRHPSRPVPEGIVSRESAIDEIFEKRHENNSAPAERAPSRELVNGRMVYVNKYGLRNGDIALKKPAGTTRITAVGESFVACVGLEDELTWESLLQKELDKLPGRYEVINAGGGGNSIDDMLSNLIDRDIKFSPDYLLFISAHNDRGTLKNNRKRSFSYKISNTLYNVSQFYAMVREKSSLIFFKDNNYYLYNYDIALSNSDADELVRVYRKRLGQIYKICMENNTVMILGLQPEFIPSGLKDLQDLLDEKRIAALGKKISDNGSLTYYEFEYYMQGRFNLEMKKFAGENNILLFDGVSIFPVDKYPYFLDEIHLNKEGSLLFARSLFAFLVDKKIAKPVQ